MKYIAQIIGKKLNVKKKLTDILWAIFEIFFNLKSCKNNDFELLGKIYIVTT